MQKSLNLPVFKRYEHCSIAQPSIAFLSMDQICHLRNRFPLSNSVVVLEPILKTAFESDMFKEEGLVSALLIHMGLLKVITLISFSDRKCSSCLFVLVGSSLAKKVDLWTNLWGSWGVCVTEARLGNKMWRVEGCTPKRFSLLFVKKYSSSIIKIDGNCLTVGIPDHKKNIYIIITSPIKSTYFSCPKNLSCWLCLSTEKSHWLDLKVVAYVVYANT